MRHKSRKSRSAAISAKCKDCIYDPKAKGSWRSQVEACQQEHTCALHPFRPMTIRTVEPGYSTEQLSAQP